LCNAGRHESTDLFEAGLLQHPQSWRRIIHPRHVRHAQVTTMTNKTPRGVVGFVEAQWPQDPALHELTRAAQNPSSMTSASALAATVVSDFMASLAPISAAATLMGFGVQASLDGIAEVQYPKRSTGIPAHDVGWIAEGNPIPTRQFSVNTVTLGPSRKLGLVATLTRELAVTISACFSNGRQPTIPASPTPRPTGCVTCWIL
jgi:hypothetical protein